MTKKLFRIAASIFALISLSVGDVLASPRFEDVTPKQSFGQVIDAGFVPPHFESAYVLAANQGGLRLYQIDLFSKSVRTVLDDLVRGRSIDAIAWSPDGKSIAFLEDEDIFVYDLESGKVKKITATQNIRAGHPVWISQSAFVFEMHDNEYGGDSVYSFSGQIQRMWRPTRGLAEPIAFASRVGELFYSVSTIDTVTSPSTFSGSIKNDSLTDSRHVNLPPAVLTEGISSVTSDGKSATLVGYLKAMGENGEVYFGNIDSGTWDKLSMPSSWNSDDALLSPDGNWLLCLGKQKTGSPGTSSSRDLLLFHRKMDGGTFN